jgi:tRNA-splicing ligase RtcB
MELMGKFASANHHLIHDAIVAFLGYPVLRQIENHHNFAWREQLKGRPVVVHRKGATPAAKGTLGIIPGSMAAPGYLVEGLGNPESLNSAAHGAGRKMSRKAASKMYHWKETREYLQHQGVHLISAGLDEVPWAYKNIDEVMEAQRDLARPIARFMPRLVKMAPAGERPED